MPGCSWERYHLIRDVIRNEPVEPSTTMCDRISAAIADEPAYSNVHTIGNGAPQATPQATSQGSSQAASTDASTSSALIRAKPSLLRTATTGFAIAASVALVTVVGLSSWQGGALQGFKLGVLLGVARNNRTFAFRKSIEHVSVPAHRKFSFS